jgi:2'-5' RNA ligase
VVTVGVSIPIPSPYGDVLQQARADYGDPLAPYVPPHVTLLGPTEIDDDAIASLVEHLHSAATAVEPFRVVLRGTGSFRPLSQVVFVQVAEGISSCERLETAIRSNGYHHDLRFPYHPHVTVAHDVDQDELDRAFADLAGFSCTFDVDAITLYQQRGDGMWHAVHAVRIGTGTP